LYASGPFFVTDILNVTLTILPDSKIQFVIDFVSACDTRPEMAFDGYVIGECWGRCLGLLTSDAEMGLSACRGREFDVVRLLSGA